MKSPEIQRRNTPRLMAVLSFRIIIVIWGACLSGIALAESDPAYGPGQLTSSPTDHCEWFFTGEITQQTVADIRSAMGQTQDCEGKGPFLYVSSAGGDVDAAMTIGRLLRQKMWWLDVHSKENPICASACVFMYVGAVNRSAKLGQLGLHRPYSVDPSLSFEESNRRINEQKERVVSYLREMNISTALFDRMNVVPPDQVVWIRTPEINRLIGGEDPAYADWTASQLAKELGITQQQYYERESISRDFCGIFVDLTDSYMKFGATAVDAIGAQWASCNDCIIQSGTAKSCNRPH